jgi:hypothetical protein
MWPLSKRPSSLGRRSAAAASFLQLPEDQRKGNALPGIPVKDSSNNEMVGWIREVMSAYQGKKPECC